MKRILIKSLFILSLSLPFHFSKISFAASIDCSKAEEKFDKTLCENPKLLSLDESMTDAFNALKERLSTEAQDDLITGQKIWLGFVRKQCSTATLKLLKESANPCLGCLEKKKRNDQNTCIEHEYDIRLQALQTSLETSKDGLVILDNTLSGIFPPRHDTTVTKECKEEEECNDENADITLSYPQIYSPYSEGIKKWNLEKRQPEPDKALNNDDGYSNGCRKNFEYKINLATSHFVSFFFTHNWYCPGMAHGNGSSKLSNIKLPSGEELDGNDIFKPDSHWDDVISKIVSDRLKPGIGSNCPGQDCSTSLERLKKIVPKKLKIIPKGIEIDFDAYEVASYASTPEPVMISWEQLKPYLRKEFLTELSLSPTANNNE